MFTNFCDRPCDVLLLRRGLNPKNKHHDITSCGPVPTQVAASKHLMLSYLWPCFSAAASSSFPNPRFVWSSFTLAGGMLSIWALYPNTNMWENSAYLKLGTSVAETSEQPSIAIYTCPSRRNYIHITPSEELSKEVGKQYFRVTDK